MCLKQKIIAQQDSNYNMLDKRARILTGLTEKDYNYILKHYTKLILKFPKVKEKAKSKLQYLKSAQISKIIAIKGCSNCIEIVSKKLDVTENDLCENCKKFITDQQIM